MKSNYKYSIFFGLIILFTLIIASCNKKLSPELAQAKLDSAKSYFFESENTAPTDKMKIYSLLEKSIKLFKELINDSDLESEALYYYGYALDKQLSDGENSINFKSMSYKNSEKISDVFEKLIKKDPSYSPDYKLSAYSKISSTWGSLGLYYLVMDKVDSAKIAFNKAKELGGITTANAEYCKNLLLSCKPNSILFVKGDLETFPLWELQVVENYRKDVTVVNIGLLSAQWYAKWITKTNVLGAKLEISYNDNQLDTLYNSTILYTNKKTRIINLSTPLSNIPNDFSMYDGTPIELNMNGRDQKDDRILLIPTDFYFLGIIDKNLFSRPIYFSLTCGREDIVSLGLSEYLILEGLASRLMPYKIPAINSLNVIKIENLLTNVFNWNSTTNEKAFIDRDFRYLAEYYKFVFIQMCYYYTQIKPDKVKCSKIFNKYFDIFPAVKLPLNEKEQALFESIKNFIK